MRDSLRFRAAVPVAELERVYRDRYQGHEADIRFQPAMENCLTFDIEVAVPHMLCVDDKWKKQFEQVANRALREMLRGCSMIAMEIQALKETP